MKNYFTRKLNFITLAVFVFTIISCNPTGNTLEDPLEVATDSQFSECEKMDFQIEDINKSLQIEWMGVPENSDTGMLFWVENKTKKEIQLSLDENVQLFICSNGKWKPIQNEINYLGEPFSISTTSFYGPVTGLNVKPNPEEVVDECVMRVYIKGEILRNGEPSGEIVAAYTDIEIAPPQ